MQEHQTAPEISLFLVSFLNSIRTRRHFRVDWRQLSSGDPSLFLQVIEDQTEIGAQGLLEGLLAKKWIGLQQHHFRRLGSRRFASL